MRGHGSGTRRGNASTRMADLPAQFGQSLVADAEVVRDLYRSEAQPEQSYSERQLYEDALDRMARELAAVEKLDEQGAVQRITEILSKSAKGRRLAESESVGEAAA